MILLFDPMSLILPEIGYAFWTLLAFVIFWLILGKFAFKPIVNSIEARNGKIEEELESAKRAKLEFEELKSKNEDLLKEAREERANMLKEAKADADAFRAQEIAKAKEDATKLFETAKTEIENQKKAAINEVRKEMSSISLQIAEKLINEKLSNDESQKALVEKLVAQTLN